jgi:hypothetical protein
MGAHSAQQRWSRQMSSSAAAVAGSRHATSRVTSPQAAQLRAASACASANQPQLRSRAKAAACSVYACSIPNKPGGAASEAVGSATATMVRAHSGRSATTVGQPAATRSAWHRLPAASSCSGVSKAPGRRRCAGGLRAAVPAGSRRRARLPCRRGAGARRGGAETEERESGCRKERSCHPSRPAAQKCIADGGQHASSSRCSAQPPCMYVTAFRRAACMLAPHAASLHLCCFTSRAV